MADIIAPNIRYEACSDRSCLFCQVIISIYEQHSGQFMNHSRTTHLQNLHVETEMLEVLHWLGGGGRPTSFQIFWYLTFF